jgi:hypothetical protein
MTNALSSAAADGDRLSYASRVSTTLENLLAPVAHRIFYWSEINALLDAKFGKDVRSGENKYLPPDGRKASEFLAMDSEEIMSSAALIMLNSHVCMTSVRPLLPSVIEIGGMLCTPPKRLPKVN